MAARAVFSSNTGEQVKPRFGEVSLDILTDILCNLNNTNKYNLEKVSGLSGCLKESRIVGERCPPQTSMLTTVILCDII